MGLELAAFEKFLLPPNRKLSLNTDMKLFIFPSKR